MSSPSDKKPLPPQVKAQLQQMDQMIAQLTEKLNEKTEEIRTKTIELESKERIEMEKLKVNAEIELAKINSKDSQVLLMQEIAGINKRLELIGAFKPIENETAEVAPEGVPQNINQQSTAGPTAGSPMGV